VVASNGFNSVAVLTAESVHNRGFQGEPSPLQPGASISHRKCPAGTLGAFVRCRNTGRLGLLSNWHVLAFSQAQLGDPIVWHQWGGDQKILAQQHHPTVAEYGGGFLSELGDAAIAWLRPDVNIGMGINHQPLLVNAVRAPKVGDVLVKIGARSGRTRARITQLGSYPFSLSHVRLNINSIILEPIDSDLQSQSICAAGDSGSVWFDEATGAGVGLHYAGQGNPFAGRVYAKAAPLLPILEKLNVALL